MSGFNQCASVYLEQAPYNHTLVELWGWPGHVIGIPKNETTQVSKAGCVHFCGNEPYYYEWSEVAQTLTTWILPIIGVIVQAPFESNARRKTFVALARWLGSPMASIAYILWNIKVTAKCALMVDMATPYNHEDRDENSEYASIRDSFFILAIMNQYSVHPDILIRERTSKQKEAEGLLRIVLFSKDLRLKDNKRSLADRRKRLAKELRDRRRRGVVPVFFSTLWFLFALGLSVESAFGSLGENATAHDLALGLLLAWLPVLVLASIIDRNPIAAPEIGDQLNKLVKLVSDSLQDPEIRAEYYKALDRRRSDPEMARRVEQVCSQFRDHYPEHGFFVDFAGQGRIRWHYGVAHAILCGIENAYVADKGRGWLSDDAETARLMLVLDDSGKKLMWFDFREVVQILGAIAIVFGTCAGAFILSFFTPTVGLGCRSGGYIIFVVVSFALLCLELLVWWVEPPPSPPRRSLMADEQAAQEEPNRNPRHHISRLSQHLKRLCRTWTSISPHRYLEYTVFLPLEIANACWLSYIVLAQTTGIYRSCACVTSTWAAGGGYVDFTQQDRTSAAWSFPYWTAGTVVGMTAMGIGLGHIVAQWMLQSHLGTSSYAHAQRGLRRTRRFRRATYYCVRLPLRWLLGKLSGWACAALAHLCLTSSAFEQKSLLWTPDVGPSKKRPTTTSLPPPSRSLSVSSSLLPTGFYTPKPDEDDRSSIPLPSPSGHPYLVNMDYPTPSPFDVDSQALWRDDRPPLPRSAHSFAAIPGAVSPGRTLVGSRGISAAASDDGEDESRGCA